jgi:hypothetical protein
METLELLGVALGLATLAGINLYLTAFVSGLAIRLGWITLAPQYESLAVLADPVVLAVSGALFFLEFFADKVPWVDSLWDAAHTVIRPVGGAMLAITALGDAHPAFDVVVGLLAGGVALTAHAAKAGTRLMANGSPEPFTNIGLSLGEDAVVLGGLGLMATHPVVFLALIIVAVGLAWWLVPQVWRGVRAKLWFLWRRAAALRGDRSQALPPTIPPNLDILLHRTTAGHPPEWAAPCVTGRGTPVGRNVFGWLLCVDPGWTEIYFAVSGLTGHRVEKMALEKCTATFEAGMICDRVTIYRPDTGARQVYLFDRTRRVLANRLVEAIRARKSAGDTGPGDGLALAAGMR